MLKCLTGLEPEEFWPFPTISRDEAESNIVIQIRIIMAKFRLKRMYFLLIN